MRSPRGNERAHLRERRNQGVLPEIGRLAGHVGAGDERDASALRELAGKIRVIGDECFAAHAKRRLDDGMAAPLDDEGQRIIDDRARPVSCDRELGERASDIDFCKGQTHATDRLHLREAGGSQSVESGKLEREGAIGRGSDFRFEFGKLVRRKAHGAGHGLAVDERRGIGGAQEPLALRLLGLDIEAEKIIMLDLELARFGELAIFALQLGDHPPALVAQRARFVKRGQRAGSHEAAIAPVQRQFVAQRRGEVVLQRAVRIHDPRAGRSEILPGSRRFSQRASDLARDPQSVADRGEIARAAAIEAQAQQRANEIRRCAQRRAQIRPQARFRCEIIDSVETLNDLARPRQGACQSLGEQAGAGGGHGQVDRGEQGAGPLAR